MLARPLARTLAVLMVVALPASAMGPFMDDAGSGGDAADTPATATPAPYGRFWGNTTPQDPADWYALQTPAALSCLDVSLVSSHALTLTLTLGPRASLTRGVDDDGLARHVLAAPAGAAPRIGLVPDKLLDGALAIGGYSVDAVALAATAVDGPSRDIPGSLASPTVVTGPCVGGMMKTDGPDTDVYGVVARAGDRIAYSFASARGDGNLTLHLPDHTQAQPTLLSGEAGSFVAPVDGVYLLSVQGPRMTVDQYYSMAILLGPDPPGQGCRPTCLA